MTKKIISVLLSAKARLLNWISLLGTIPLKSLLVFISIQLVVFAIAFIVLGLLPVHREVRSISEGLTNQSSHGPNKPTQARVDLANRLTEAEHHEAFLNSNIELSKTDSISLIIDLSDSLAILSFKGVNLFKAKISKIKLNKGLEKSPLHLLDSLFSGPFLTEGEFSTIEKFPIVIKKAPKDSIEANLSKSAPELPRHSDVFCFFSFSNNFSINIQQEEENLVGPRSDYQKYKREKSKWLRRKGLNAIFRPDQKGYTYQLSIEIPREDARSIYRALPINPIVIVRY